jgi:hypothetical protein
MKKILELTNLLLSIDAAKDTISLVKYVAPGKGFEPLRARSPPAFLPFFWL